MLAPSTRQRLCFCLLVFGVTWLRPVSSTAHERPRASVASHDDLATSSARTAAHTTSAGSGKTDANTGHASPTVARATEIAVLDGPLLPEVIGLSLTPLETTPPAPLQIPSARKPVARGLLPLFVTYGVLQGLDVHSTLTAIDRGASEGNPVMAPFASRPAAFIAFKAGVGAATILAADRLAKHNRFAAYALMIGLNSAYAAIVAHNYRVAQGR